MSEQRALFSPPPAQLTDKQVRALAVVKAAGGEGITGRDLGFRLHGHTTHACDFCQSAGLGYLRSLKKKNHVRQTKGGVYIALDLADEKPAAMTEESPY